MINSQEETDVKEQKQLLFETRSEEVQSIMGRMPSWIIRSGITFVGVLLVVLLSFSAYVSYPDIVPAQVVIYTSAAPLRITAKVSGGLRKVYVRNGGSVTKGQMLALIDNEADYGDVIYACNIAGMIDTARSLAAVMAKTNADTMLHLGDGQSYYSDMRLAALAYHNGVSGTAQEDKVRESAQKVIRYFKAWEERYVIKSQAAGKVTLLRNEGDMIVADELLMLVSPPSFAARAQGSIPVAGAGKVKTGQKVIINLAAYPAQEFGSLQGKIVSISDVAIDDRYIIDIKLDNGLLSGNKKKIPAQPELKGTAEILANNKTILQRIIRKIDR